MKVNIFLEIVKFRNRENCGGASFRQMIAKIFFPSLSQDLCAIYPWRLNYKRKWMEVLLVIFSKWVKVITINLCDGMAIRLKYIYMYDSKTILMLLSSEVYLSYLVIKYTFTLYIQINGHWL